MEGTSSFARLEATPVTGWRKLVGPSFGALEGAAAAIPSSLGAAILVYGQVAPELIASGVFATMLAVALVHLATAGSARPICVSGRMLEATTLAAALHQVLPQLAAWGLPDTLGVRLAFLCLICGGAGLVVGLLYLLRAQRLTPFIPAPVFAGFSNSIAVALLLSQWRTLRELASSVPVAGVVGSITIAAFATGYAIRRWLPGRPAAAAALVVGLLAGLLWNALGQPPAVVGASAIFVPLPVSLADFGAFLGPQVQLWPVTLLVLGNAALLGAMMFINNAMAAQAMTHLDRRTGAGKGEGLVSGLSLMAGGLAGAAPVSGSIMACLAVARTSSLRAPAMLLMAAVVAAVYLTGALGHMPLAAVAGVLLCEAWFLVDRPSLRMAADWLLRRSLPVNAREDLALIAAVTAVAVLTNMVLAAFTGLMLGLFLVAVRSARQPVRHVWTGRQLSSNCARGTGELRVLAERGEELRVFELEGDLFFAVGATLDRFLTEGSRGAACIVLEWSRVRHIDSSVASMLAAFEQQASAGGVVVVHAGAGRHDTNVAEELRRRLPAAQLTTDLDFALELAENHLIARYGEEARKEASTLFDSFPLFQGFSAEDRATLEAAMTHRLFKAGEVILAAGSPGNELMLVLQGCASIVVADDDGQPVRLAGARRGSVIGEIGFLDGSARSASVVAQEDLLVAILKRDDFERLAAGGHAVVPKLLSNLSVALARHLRHTNRLALARSRTR